MGLIKAAQAAAGTVLADQWKEFFYCDSLDNDTLLVRGQKRTGSRSSNTKGNDNIISNWSVVSKIILSKNEITCNHCSIALIAVC